MKEKIENNKNNLPREAIKESLDSAVNPNNIFNQTEINRKKEEDKETQEALKKEIEKIDIKNETTETEQRARIEKYIERNIPEYLDREKPSLIFKAFKFINKFLVKEIIGKENLPQREKLFVVNHRGGESGLLVASIEKPVHIVSAETINWKGRSKVLRWFLGKIGAVPVRETFSHLSEDQKEQVLEKAPKSEKNAHKEAIKNKGMGNLKNIKTIVALLLKGEDLAIFTEGPFSRLDDDERKSYAGYALVAREYKRITGENLEIIPTGIRNNKVSFGESFHVDSEGRQSKEELEDIATEKIHSLYNSLS